MSDPVPDSTSLRACHCCGLVQELHEPPAGQRLVCGRCGTSLTRARGRSSLSHTLAFATTAGILFLPAIHLPVLTIEKFGLKHSASVWDGAVTLLRHGEILVGLAILVCSILVPVLKIGGLIAITVPGMLRRQHRALFYRLIEWAGRWSMLDVLLVALLVAVLKLRDLVSVIPGPGALTFTLCVVFSLLASASFDPHAIWEEESS